MIFWNSPSSLVLSVETVLYPLTPRIFLALTRKLYEHPGDKSATVTIVLFPGNTKDLALLQSSSTCLYSKSYDSISQLPSKPGVHFTLIERDEVRVDDGGDGGSGFSVNIDEDIKNQNLERS